MEVKVVHFAQLRELCGLREEYVVLGNRYLVSDAWNIIQNRHSEFAALAFVPIPAVNGAYASWDRPLTEGDELVFLGPMSGG